MKNNVLEELPETLKEIADQLEEEQKKESGIVIERLAEAIEQGDRKAWEEYMEIFRQEAKGEWKLVGGFVGNEIRIWMN